MKYKVKLRDSKLEKALELFFGKLKEKFPEVEVQVQYPSVKVPSGVSKSAIDEIACKHGLILSKG